MIYRFFDLCHGFYKYFIFVILLSFIFSCVGNGKDNRYSLYDMPGFDPGTRPNIVNQGSNNGIRFEEFYQQDPNASVQERMITDRIRSNDYRRDYINSNISPSYGQQSLPNSRFYSNPYEFRQPNSYQSNDMEQYYIPPNYYQNIERSYSVPFN